MTSNDVPIVPLTPSERHRAELIAAGRLRPRRLHGLPSPLPASSTGPALSELLLEMRGREHT